MSWNCHVQETIVASKMTGL